LTVARTEGETRDTTMGAGDARVFEALFRHSPLGIVILSSEGVILDVNESAVSLLGHTRDELLNRTSAALGLYDFADRERDFEHLRANGSLRDVELRLTVKSGTVRDVLFSVERIEVAGEVSYVATFLDITARKKAEVGYRELAERTRELNSFLSAIVDNMPAMVFVKDAQELRFELFNRAGEDLLGLSRADLIGKADHDFFPQEQAEFFQAKDREVLRSGTLLEIPEEPIETEKGRRWLYTRKIPILGEDGAPHHLLGISIDITERRETDEKLRLLLEEHERQAAVIERLSLTDELTGLKNRRGFMMLAEQHARLAQRGDRVFAILFLDLDDLKTINDSMGHESGDRAIRKTATVLEASVRDADIVGRLGGDEFVLLLHDATPATVESVIARIREGVSTSSDLYAPELSLSLGTAFQERAQPKSVADLLMEADRQMYANKRSRR
jgi:diguanylate cyclase (GGDEF)-like protein/PAS domain S-box-containing protein